MSSTVWLAFYLAISLLFASLLLIVIVE